jgi:single-strand DNA-binding protein
MVNKVVLIGYVGKVMVRQDSRGGDILNISLATTKKWNKDGQKQEKTQWHNVSMFGPQAKSLCTILNKGQKVFVDGEIEYREYEKDGVKKNITSITARDLQIVDWGNKKEDEEEKPQEKVEDELLF